MHKSIRITAVLPVTCGIGDTSDEDQKHLKRPPFAFSCLFLLYLFVVIKLREHSGNSSRKQLTVQVLYRNRTDRNAHFTEIARYPKLW